MYTGSCAQYLCENDQVDKYNAASIIRPELGVAERKHHERQQQVPKVWQYCRLLTDHLQAIQPA